MADIELSDLEVPSWPVEAYPFEPIHSLFARFAERNGQTSTAVFARHVGLNWTHPNLSELLTFCSKYPIRHLERSIAATPTAKDERLIINGQIFNPYTDWSIYQPRVCEGCLHEALYYRNWWDITAMHHCPIHDRPLIARKGSSRLRLWYSKVGETPDGGQFASYAPRVKNSVYKWESYLLGRMSVMRNDPHPLLDAADLCHVIEAAELLGAMASVVQDPTRHRPQTPTQARAKVLTDGAQILLSDPYAIYECARAYVLARQKYLEQAGEQPTHNAFFSGLLLKLVLRSNNPLLPIIRRQLDLAIDDTKVYIRRVKATHIHATKTARVPFGQLVTEVGLRKHQVLQLAVALDMVPEQRSHGAYLPLSAKDMNALREIAEGLIGTSDTADYLGLSFKEINWLHTHQILLPALKARHRTHDLYRRQDLDALLNRTRALVQIDADAQSLVSLHDYSRLSGMSLREVVLGLLTGALNAAGWDKNQQGLHGCLLSRPSQVGQSCEFRPRSSSKKPGLNKAEAAAALGASSSVTKALLAAGHLRLVSCTGNARVRVDADSVRQFREQYAPAHLYAEVLRCRPSSAYAILSEHGIVRLPTVNAKDASFVERRAVRSILGLKHDPDHPSSDVSISFWKEFARHVDRSRSSTRMFSCPRQGKVTLYSGDRAVSVVFRVDRERQTIGYSLTCDQEKSSRRFDRISNRLSEVEASLGRDAVYAQKERRIVIAEVMPCDLGDKQDWARLFGWIEQRMTYFRSIFSAKSPPRPDSRLGALNTSVASRSDPPSKAVY